jgi:hypothetical protein
MPRSRTCDPDTRKHQIVAGGLQFPEAFSCGWTNLEAPRSVRRSPPTPP